MFKLNYYRLSEIILPILTWVIITMPIWLSPFHPAIVAYFIFFYLIYFFYKTIKMVYFAAISYQLMNKSTKVNWNNKIKKIKDYQKLWHVVLIVNYKEPLEKVSKTLEKIKEQNYDLSRVIVVLAEEEREVDAKARSQILTKNFLKYFGGFYTCYHPLIAGEVVGKASNEAYAAKYIAQKLKDDNIDFKNVMITICDADSLLPKNYLANITYNYLIRPENHYHFYWAPVLLYTNFWQIKLPIRVQAILSSVVRLSYLSWVDDLMPISTYSTNLWLLNEVDYWDVDIIPEDWHIWLQCFFKYGKKIKTVPIYLPITRDAVIASGFIKTVKTRYDQERRWAWGVTDIAYFLRRMFNTPHISWRVKIKRFLHISETHLFWPSAFFILTISASIPPLVNPAFKRTVMGFLLPKLSSFILTFTTILLMGIIYFDYKMRQKIKIKTELKNLPLLFIQWYLLPIISFIFSSLPALDAHTKLLLGKKLTYKVTEKS